MYAESWVTLSQVVVQLQSLQWHSNIGHDGGASQEPMADEWHICWLLVLLCTELIITSFIWVKQATAKPNSVGLTKGMNFHHFKSVAMFYVFWRTHPVLPLKIGGCEHIHLFAPVQIQSFQSILPCTQIQSMAIARSSKIQFNIIPSKQYKTHFEYCLNPICLLSPSMWDVLPVITIVIWNAFICANIDMCPRTQ
jgi:hypothetical protein